MHHKAYQSPTATRSEKSRISRHVLDIVQAYGGRFVKYEPDEKGYIEIDMTARREKVSHALRSFTDIDRRRTKKSKPWLLLKENQVAPIGQAAASQFTCEAQERTKMKMNQAEKVDPPLSTIPLIIPPVYPCPNVSIPSSTSFTNAQHGNSSPSSPRLTTIQGTTLLDCQVPGLTDLGPSQTSHECASTTASNSTPCLYQTSLPTTSVLGGPIPDLTDLGPSLTSRECASPLASNITPFHAAATMGPSVPSPSMKDGDLPRYNSSIHRPVWTSEVLDATNEFDDIGDLREGISRQNSFLQAGPIAMDHQLMDERSEQSLLCPYSASDQRSVTEIDEYQEPFISEHGTHRRLNSFLYEQLNSLSTGQTHVQDSQSARTQAIGTRDHQGHQWLMEGFEQHEERLRHGQNVDSLDQARQYQEPQGGELRF